ncbi:hypothetical protein [Streptomyces sp. t39]|uniref:hypothetical protein n=1 Tax=Streptomyces sp. t39 TaxID=1828156 RepID=UPI0011CE89FF|nr:hypothetical protein [Streptomyces sp. t39]
MAERSSPPPDDLVRLQRDADAARREAERQGHAPEARRVWQEATAVVKNAVAEHAAAEDVDARELERDVQEAAREANGADGG